jgi:peroxin-11B
LHESSHSASAIKPLNVFRAQLGLTRKWIGVGRFFEHYVNAAILYAEKPTLEMDRSQQWLNIARQVAYGFYLTLDSVTYMDLLKLRKPFNTSTSRRLQRASLKAWLVALNCSIIASLYSMWKLKERVEESLRVKGLPGSLKAYDVARYVDGSPVALHKEKADVDKFF